MRRSLRRLRCLPRIPSRRRTADAASLDVVKAIGSVRCGGNDRPAEPVIIKKATVVKTPKK